MIIRTIINAHKGWAAIEGIGGIGIKFFFLEEERRGREEEGIFSRSPRCRHAAKQRASSASSSSRRSQKERFDGATRSHPNTPRITERCVTAFRASPVASRRVASRRDETRRRYIERERERERGRIVNPALFHRYREVKSRVHRNTRHGMRSLEAFWIAWKARIPVVNRYCERTVYGLLCVYNAYWCERISRVRSFVRINIRFERRECWNKWMKIRY